jgi:hypothetical protein
MVHKSPTDEEYAALVGAKVTPSMPTDKDRYIDFQNLKGEYQKIVYPDLFRITATGSSLTNTGVLTKIQQLLDAKSTAINAI